MKILLICIVAAISFAACTKNTSAPATDPMIFFKNDDVAVQNMVVVPTSSNAVTFNFTVTLASNINRIELMSSKTPNTFCTIKAIDLPADFSGTKSYSFCDSTMRASTMYYLLRFKKNNYNWVYTSYLTVNVK